MAFVVYLYKNTVNNKVYIGYTNSIEHRWAVHLSDARRGTGHYFHDAIRKYGTNVWDLTILENSDSEIEIKAAECKWINYYKSNNPSIGYNLTSGGEGGSLNQSTKDKISQKLLQFYADPQNRILVSEKTKEAMAKLSDEKKEKMLVNWTPELREQASESAKARCTPEWSLKHSDAIKGKHFGKISKEMLLEACRECSTNRQIAKKLGCTFSNISYLAKIFDIKKEIKDILDENKKTQDKPKRKNVSPEVQENKRQKMLELWNDPVRREEYLRKRKEGKNKAKAVVER